MISREDGERIKVSTLFAGANINRTIDAYLLVSGECSDAKPHMMIRDRLQFLAFLKKAIVDNMQLIAEETGNAEASQTVFITEYENGEWECRGETEFSCVFVEDTEVIDELEKDGKDCFVSGYDMEMMSLEEIAGMYIARPSVESYGAEACCALILRELFYFGLIPETREENRRSFLAKIDASLAEIENGGTSEFSSEEFWNICLNACKTQDEREHMMAERIFHESVQEIENRYARQVFARNNKKFTDMLRDEYSRSNRS